MVKPDNPPKGKGRAPSSAPSKLPPPSNNNPSPEPPSNPNSDQHTDTQQQDPLVRLTRHSRLSAANTVSSTSTSSAWTQNLLPEEGSASQDTASSRASTSSRRSSLRGGRGSIAAEERASPPRAEEEREAREEGASWRASSSESPRPSTSSQAGPSRSTRGSLSKPISNESPAHPSSSKPSGSAIPSSSSSSLKRLPSKLNRTSLRPSPPPASSSKRATSSSSSLSSSSTHQPYPTPTSNDANSPLGLNPASPARSDNNVEVEVASSSRAARARNSNIRKAVEEATALSSIPSLNSSVEAGSDVLEAEDVAEARGVEQDDEEEEDVLIVEADQEDEGEGEMEQEYSEAESEPSAEELERRRLAAIEEEETQMRLEDDFDDINEWTDQLLTKKHCYPTFSINSSVYTRPKRIPSPRCSVEQILRFASPDPELDQEPFDLFGAEDSPARSSAEPAASPSSRKRPLSPKLYRMRSSPAKRRLAVASSSTTALDLPQPSSSKQRSTLPSSSAPKHKPSRNAVASTSSIPIRITLPANLRRKSVPAQPTRVASASPSPSDHSDASSTVSYSRAVAGLHSFAYVLVPELPELAERDQRRRDKGKGREVIVIEDSEEEEEEEEEDEDETLRRRKAKGKGRAMLDEEKEEEEEAPESASRSRSSSELIEIQDEGEDEGDDEGDDEESDGYDEDDDVYVDLGGDDDANMGSENEEQGFRLRERSRKGKETGTYSRITKRKESLKHAPRSDSSYEDDMERETTRYAPESSVSHDSDSSDIIVLSPLSSSAYDPPPSEPKRPPTARKTRPSSIALIEIQVSPELSIHLLRVEDHYLRTDPRGDPVDETQYSLITNETGYTQLVPYLAPASSSCAEEITEEGGSPMEVEQELELVQPSPKVDDTAMDSNDDDDDDGGEVVLFQPFSRGAFKDRPRKKSFTTGRSEEGGEAMEVDEEMRPRGETEGAMSRTGRISKKKTFYGENSDEDNPSVASPSTSLLHYQPLPDTQPKSKPRRKPTRSNASYPAGATSCHQCRRGTLHLKATCIDCELRYCKSCLASRYGLTFEDMDLETFSCPTCNDFCNCSCCLNRKGYRGRAGAFRGVSIRCYLAGAVHGTNLSIMAFLDSKVEEAGGQAAWSMIEGSEDMQGMLDAVAKRMREKDGRRESTELESGVEARQTRTTIVESERPGRLFGRLRGGDAEVDLASLVGENGAGKGKGKTIDSDGETVDSYHSDPEEPEPEPEPEVTVDEDQDAQVSQHLEDVPSFLYPHLPTDEAEDEEEDEPEPLAPPPPPTFQQLSANRFESPTKLSLAPKSFSEMTDEEMRIKWEPDDDATVPYLSESQQPNHLFPSSPLALASTSNSLYPPTTTPSSFPKPDAPLPSLLYSSDEPGCYSPPSTNQTTPDQRMEDIEDGTEGGPSSSFREGSATPLPPIFEASSTIPLLPAVPWDSEGTLGEEYRNMITGATLA